MPLETVRTGVLSAEVEHSSEEQQHVSKVDTEESARLEAEIDTLHKEVIEENERMDHILEQISDYFSSILLPIDAAELSRVVAEIEELDMQRRELNERIDHFPQKILDLLSQKKNKMDAAEYTRIVAEINKFDNKQKKSAKSIDQHMQKLFDHCSLLLSLQDEIDAAESASDLVDDIQDLDNDRREVDKRRKCISQKIIDSLLQQKDPIELYSIKKFQKEFSEENNSLDYIMQQIIGHYSTLFCKQEDTEMDAAESVQLLAVIDDFEKERRKGVELMEHILQQLNDMFYLEDAKIDGAEQARLISEFLEVAKKQREEGIMLDYYMEEIFAHCYSHLACIFKVTFEE